MMQQRDAIGFGDSIKERGFPTPILGGHATDDEEPGSLSSGHRHATVKVGPKTTPHGHLFT